MNISPVNFKRVEAMRPMDYNKAIANAYKKAGNLPEKVDVTPNSIKIQYPESDFTAISDFDDKGNMKMHTIYKGDNSIYRKYIYYPEIQRPAAAIEYNSKYDQINEISLYNRHGEEIHNFNYQL